jgi:hypothetical protein
MKDISRRRCHNHPGREAVSFCTECGRSFCRECITEHDDRMFCASCIGKLLKPSASRRFHLSDILTIGQSVPGIFITWLVFYYLAQILLSLPSSFHDGTIWQSDFREGR